MPFTPKNSCLRKDAYPTWLICHPQRSMLTPSVCHVRKSRIVPPITTIKNEKTIFQTEHQRSVPNPFYRRSYQTDPKSTKEQSLQLNYNPESNHKKSFNKMQRERFFFGYFKCLQSWFCLRIRPDEVHVGQMKTSQSKMNQYWRTKLNSPQAVGEGDLGDTVMTTAAVESSKDVNAWSKLYSKDNLEQDPQMAHSTSKAIQQENPGNLTNTYNPVNKLYTVQVKRYRTATEGNIKSVQGDKEIFILNNKPKSIQTKTRNPSRRFSKKKISCAVPSRSVSKGIYSSRKTHGEVSEKIYFSQNLTKNVSKKICSTPIHTRNDSRKMYTTSRLLPRYTTRSLPQSRKTESNTKFNYMSTMADRRESCGIMKIQNEAQSATDTRTNDKSYFNKKCLDEGKWAQNKTVVRALKCEDKCISEQHFERYVCKSIISVQNFEKQNSGESADETCVQCHEYQNKRSVSGVDFQNPKHFNGNMTYIVNNAKMCTTLGFPRNIVMNEPVIGKCGDGILKDFSTVQLSNTTKMDHSELNIEANIETENSNHQKLSEINLDDVNDKTKISLLKEDKDDTKFERLRQKIKKKQKELDTLRKRIEYEAKDVCHALKKIQVLDKQPTAEQKLKSKQEKNSNQSCKGVLEKVVGWNGKRSKEANPTPQRNYNGLLGKYELIGEECNVFNGIYQELQDQRPKIDKLMNL